MKRERTWEAIERDLAREFQRELRVEQASIDRVMTRLRSDASPVSRPAAPPPGRASWWASARHRHSASALIAAALLVFAIEHRVRSPMGDRHRTASVQAATRMPFSLAAPGATRVSLVGDFNDWNPAAMPLAVDGPDGLWTVVVPLPAGRHAYAFVIDGKRWVTDSNAPRAAENEYGQVNSIVFVAAAR